MGTYHRNPLLGTREYELEYYDGTYDCYFTNIISGKIYSQVDSEGHQFLVLEEISYHWSDGTAIAVTDGFIITRGGNKFTTFLVELKGVIVGV